MIGRVNNVDWISLIILCIFCASSLKFHAQKDLEFIKLRSLNGDAQSITYSVEQDEEGNIWIGTEEGVMRYNSSKFFNYNKYRGLPEEVGNRVPVVYIDPENNIWLGTENGICLYSRRLDKFDFIQGEFGYFPTLVKSIQTDSEGQLWIGGYNGLWKYTKEGKVIQDLANFNIQVISVDKDRLIIGTSNNLLVYYPESGELVEKEISVLQDASAILKTEDGFLIGTKDGGLFQVDEKITSPEKINLGSKYPISEIVPNTEGGYWLASDGGGLILLNLEPLSKTIFISSQDDERTISSNGVYDILIGQEGIIWIATYGGGINIVDPAKMNFQKIRHRPNDINSLKNNFTRAIEEDADGNIWFGTKEGISIWDKRRDRWRQLPNFSSIVLTLKEDGEYIWAGTYGEGVYRINRADYALVNYSKFALNRIPLSKVYSSLLDDDGNLWLGGIDGKLIKVSKDGVYNELPINQIRAMAKLPSGMLVLGGRQGIFLVDPHNEKIIDIEELKPNKDSLSYFNINAIEVCDNNKLAIATNGAGLIIYDIESRKIDVFDVESGISTDIIQGVIPTGENEYWASTTKGLVHIFKDKEKPRFKIYVKEDGLTSTEFNYGSYKKLSDGTLAFGGIEGVTLFEPAKLGAFEHKPNIIFESFSLFNKVIDPGSDVLPSHINTVGELDLNHKENSFTFEFAGISQSSPSKIKYSWQLEGFDMEWTGPKAVDRVSYTNINPGEYVFKVKAANREGEFGEERMIKLKIGKPWWATNLAYLTYFVLGLVILAGGIFITRMVINRRNAQEQISFFNNITHEIKTPLTILLSSLEKATKNRNADQDSNKKIKSTINRLNSLFEQMLNFQKVTIEENAFQEVVKINVEEYVKDVADNFKPWVKERKLNINVQNDWGEEVFYYDKENLNKVFFNLISNAIKYSKEGGVIDVRINKIDGNRLKVDIKDDGMGIPTDQQKFILKKYYRARNVINSQQPGTGLGLMMVKNLVEKAGGKIGFQSEENVGSTFTVELLNKDNLYKESAISNSAVGDDVFIHERSGINEFMTSKILIVEDNDELREILSETLGTYFQVYTAVNGKQGLEKTSEIFPDIILTDLIMPEMDGLEMSKLIKGDISLNHIPIFMFTVLRNSMQKIESLESGIAEYIEKPIDIDVLLAKITNMLSYQKKLRERYINKAEADSAIEYRTQSDKEFVSKLEDFILEKIIDDSLSVHDLCQFVGMSRTSLYMKLKNLINLSPQDFIIHTKLNNAKSLLLKGDANIKEIAYQCGFSNPKYFSTSFKKFFGISPSKYVDSISLNSRKAK